MSLVVNHNMMAANVANNLNTHYGRLSTSTQRLSTGMRINSAADDAAGLAIRELQRADIAAFHQGARNANDAISLIQVADGALSIIDEKLIRMKELAEQAATGTYDSIQRLMINSEYQQMASEITRIAIATDFNGIHLLDGSLSGAHDGSGLTATGKMKIHFGSGNDSAEDYYYIEIGCVTAAALGLGDAAYATLDLELTTEYFEKLRNASAQAAYDTTYKQKYAEYYAPIYNKLTTGTSEQAAIDAVSASAQANAIASAMADKFATEDKEMAIAAMDKVYNDAYLTPYLTSYQKNIEQGMSAADAQAEADKMAAAKALQAVIAANENVISQGVSTLTALDALPPANSKGIAAMIDEGVTLAYDNAYQSIYDNLFAATVANALTNTDLLGLSTTDATPTHKTGLSADQVLRIHNAVNAQASNEANEVANKLRANLEEIASAYGENGDTYKNAYDAALDAYGDEKYAASVAEATASKAAWSALRQALESGSSFGSDPVVAGDFSSNVTVPLTSSLPTADQFDDLLSNVIMNSPELTDADFRTMLEATVAPLPSVDPSNLISYITSGSNSLYKYIYDEVYNRQYNNILSVVDNDTYNVGSSFSEEQIANMQAVAANSASTVADRVIGKLENDLQNIGNINDIEEALKQAFYNAINFGNTEDSLKIEDFTIEETQLINFPKADGTLTTVDINEVAGNQADLNSSLNKAGGAGLAYFYNTAVNKLNDSSTVSQIIRQSIFDTQYNDLLDAVADKLGTSTLDENQVKAIVSIAGDNASAVAYTVSEELRSQLELVYQNSYDGSSGDSKGYGYYYDMYIAADENETDAAKHADIDAKRDAWTAVEAALIKADSDGTSFISSNLTGLFNTPETVLTIPDVQNASNGSKITVNLSAHTGTDAEQTQAFQTAGNNGLSFLSDKTSSTDLRDAVYLETYNRRYIEARDKIVAALGLSDPSDLNENQWRAIEKIADDTATAIAYDVSSQVKAGLQAVYDQAYDSSTASENSKGYNNYYNQYISAGQEPDAAKASAIVKIKSEDAWNAVKSVLTAANVNGTPFGVNSGLNPVSDAEATDGLLGHILDPKQFSYSSQTFKVPDAYDVNGDAIFISLDAYDGTAVNVDSAYQTVGSAGVAFLNDPGKGILHPVSITGSVIGTDEDAESFYSELASDITDWLDNLHAMNGGDDAMVAAAKAFNSQYTLDSTPTLRAGGSVATQEQAQQAIVAINEAIVSKDKIRANLGAVQNRLENTIQNINIQAENLQAAESRISDVDVATEMTEFVRQQILTQSAVAMLAQANSMPQMAMQIIGG